MYLLDTNIWLELLLEQERAEEVARFLEATDAGDLALTEFSFFSIGVILTRLGEIDLLTDFIDDVLTRTKARRVRLDDIAVREIPEVIRNQQLDFDDAYQYAAARRFDLDLVSFDRDFDRCDLERLEPADLL